MQNDLISRSALIKSFEDAGLGDHSLIESVLAAGVYAGIENAPTIDAVPVVHSSWGYRAYRGDARITVSGEVVCRKCHAPFFRIRGHWFKYCPNCGAKMDGGAEG